MSTRAYNLLGLALIGALFFGLAGCEDPPMNLLESAKNDVKLAADAGALRYAERPYRTAEQLVQSGWMEIARQNGRLGFLRDYKVADSILRLASTTALQAKQAARDSVTGVADRYFTGSNELRRAISQAQGEMRSSLVRNRLEQLCSRAEFYLRISQSLAAKAEYNDALDNINKGKYQLQRMVDLHEAYQDEEASKVKVWDRWVEETLEQSETSGSYAVIVDKSKHKMYLVRAGKRIKAYDCELGHNPGNQKLASGDGATPEGKYRVTKVRPTGSKYYKALLINYPNENDRQRFNENKRAGVISQRAGIGGLIEIHGDGGRGKDWTEGCVALKNKDMDHLMNYVTAGTPVTIVRKATILQ